jgi:hypothetical protein
VAIVQSPDNRLTSGVEKSWNRAGMRPAGSGHAAAVPPSNVMNSRRLTPSMGPSCLNSSCSAMLPHAEAAAESTAPELF